ncbi:MAG TPA: Ig-like domain-containing protein [Kofleriaceae bacterium]|nr:Ig-like domain-containing protein [Kofleriaceae bacterium]
MLATLAAFALATACSDPDLSSDLDTDGPPDVVEINVGNQSAPTDPNGNAEEAATYCRPGDEFKVSTFYCPLARDEADAPIPGDRELAAPITDALPIDWHVRIIFTELLDPDIEDLVEVDGVTMGSLAETQPVSVSCGGTAVPYDGWYDPSGNNLSYPPGPSLVVTPLDFVATGSPCQISVVDGAVIDKSGDTVPADQLGPYDFAIAPLEVAESSPADASEGVAVDSVVQVSFNAPIDIGTIAGRIALTTGDTEVVGTLDFDQDPETEEIIDDIIVFTPDAPLAPGTSYTITVDDGIEDIAGGALAQEEPFSATFTTGE